MGFEYWSLEVLEDLRAEGYQLSIATIFPFENHGEQWNEANQAKLARFKQVDFVKYAYPRYENPGQFRDYNQFYWIIRQVVICFTILKMKPI